MYQLNERVVVRFDLLDTYWVKGTVTDIEKVYDRVFITVQIDDQELDENGLVRGELPTIWVEENSESVAKTC